MVSIKPEAPAEPSPPVAPSAPVVPGLTDQPPAAQHSPLADKLGIWATLFGLPSTIVGVLDISTPRKVAWFVTFMVTSSILTFVILRITDRRQTKQWRSPGFLIGVGAAVVGSVVVGSLAGNAAQDEIRSRVQVPCLDVGAGSPEFERAFVAAYAKQGGANALGCPVEPVGVFLAAHYQGLESADGPSMIIATDPEVAHILKGPAYEAFREIAGGDTIRAFAIAGFPSDDGTTVGDTQQVLLGNGSGLPNSALVGKTGQKWHWVQPSIWARYKDPAVRHSLGLPKGVSQPWNGGVRQQFEHDWLWYQVDRGVLTGAEYRAGSAGFRPYPGPIPQQSLVYQVDAKGGAPHEIPSRGYVEQTFASQLPAISEVGVVVGLDPAHQTMLPEDHFLNLSLRDSSGKVLFSRDLSLRNNVLTVTSFTPIPVKPGEVYSLRVSNESPDILGVYLNDPAQHGNPADPKARAHLVGEVPQPEPHEDASGALAARIQGTS